MKSKIESLILEQHRELFSSILSENAVRKLVKQKALEIALNLGLEKKFKGTKRWLNSFLRRCQLGCSPVNNVGKTVGSNAVKQQKLNREHATLDSTVSIVSVIFGFLKFYMMFLLWFVNYFWTFHWVRLVSAPRFN